MKPIEVAQSYDELVEVWSSESFPRDNGTDQHRRALAFCRHKRRALDIGCGSSGRLVELLVGEGFDVEGLDLSHGMLERARQRHPGVVFHHADVCEWIFPHQYDFISAWDSVWHVPLSEQEQVLHRILLNLTSGGVAIFTMGGLDHPSEKTNRDMGPRMYYSTLGIPRTLEVVAEAGCLCRHLEYDQYPQPHVYVIAQRA